MRFVGISVGQPLHLRISGGDSRDLARQQPVDAAQNGVLFVDNGRNTVLMRSEQRWQRGIAAEAYHHGWLKGFMETARNVSPGLDALKAPEPAHGTTRHYSARQDMALRLVKTAGDFCSPITRDQHNLKHTLTKYKHNAMRT